MPNIYSYQALMRSRKIIEREDMIVAVEELSQKVRQTANSNAVFWFKKTVIFNRWRG
jgi:flagellar biosynthesis regulator FlbT